MLDVTAAGSRTGTEASVWFFGKVPRTGEKWAKIVIGKASLSSASAQVMICHLLCRETARAMLSRSQFPPMTRAGRGQGAQYNLRIRWIKCPHHK